VLIRQREAGGVKVINLSATRLRIRTDRVGLRPGVKEAIVYTYDLEGNSLKGRTVEVRDRWLDLSCLSADHLQ